MTNYYSKSTWALYSLTRFFLATAVLFLHMDIFADITPWSILFHSLGGKSAVISFLLISGVSVGYSFKKRPDGYLERRFMRIYPLYFFGVLSAMLLMFMLPHPYILPHLTMVPTGWKTAVANFFFGQGFVSIVIPYNIPLWSISIEVFLYLLAPVLTRLRIQIIVALIVSSMLLFLFGQNSSFLYGYDAIIYAWPWLIGFLISVKEQRKIAFVLSIMGIFAILYSGLTSNSLSWPTYIITVLVIFYGHNVYVSDRLEKLFDFLGEISYPLYIFHFPLAMIFFHITGEQTMWMYVTFILLAVLVLNYVLDRWLKHVFWQPLVDMVKNKILPIMGQLNITRFVLDKIGK